MSLLSNNNFPKIYCQLKIEERLLLRTENYVQSTEQTSKCRVRNDDARATKGFCLKTTAQPKNNQQFQLFLKLANSSENYIV